MSIEEIYNYCFEKAKSYNAMAANYDEESEQYKTCKERSNIYIDIFLKLDAALMAE